MRLPHLFTHDSGLIYMLRGYIIEAVLTLLRLGAQDENDYHYGDLNNVKGQGFDGDERVGIVCCDVFCQYLTIFVHLKTHS